MVYATQPPYAVQQTGVLDADTVQRFIRLARYWDLVANSGRFTQTLSLLLQGPSAFYAFLDFADGLWATSAQTSRLTPEDLVDALFDHLTVHRKLPATVVRQSLLADYVSSGARASPKALQGMLLRAVPQPAKSGALTSRQNRHGDTAPTMSMSE